MLEVYLVVHGDIVFNQTIVHYNVSFEQCEIYSQKTPFFFSFKGGRYY